MAESILERKSFQKGEVVFREGSEGNCAFVVQAGEIEICKVVEDKTVVLGSVGAGGIFGEMALIDDKPRMASARGAIGGTVIIITRAMFEQKLAKADPFLKGLLKIFANNIRRMASSSGPKEEAKDQEAEWENAPDPE
jgi:CRP/FNR family transcriptional regulator, cyclic AMP receptor protein